MPILAIPLTMALAVRRQARLEETQVNTQGAAGCVNAGDRTLRGDSRPLLMPEFLKFFTRAADRDS